MKPARYALTGFGFSLLLAACSSSETPGGSGGAAGSGATGAVGNGGTGSPGAGGASGTGVGGSAGSGTSVGGAAGSGTGGSSGTGVGGTVAAGSGPIGSAGTGGGGNTGNTGATGAAGTAGMGPLGGMGGGAGTGAAGASPGGAGGSGNTGAVTVQLGMVRQDISGFGINDTWANAMSDSDADAMFSTTKGIGLSILRVGMGSDGSPMSTNIPGDITKAKARGVSTIIGSCWSPPANCKSNNSVNDGGHTNSSCYDSWATTIAKFAKDQGLYAMSIANEPDFASCGSSEPCNGNYPTTLYTADEMVAFVKVAGPKLKANGVKVIAPEASEWLHNWSNMSACCSEPGMKESSNPLKGMGYDYGHALAKDATAWDAFDIMGVHQYDTQKAEPWPADVTAAKKPVWQTEMSGVKWWPEQGPSSDIKNGVIVAGWIHDALTTGEASAWLWWWWNAIGTDDNEGLYLKNGTDTKRHYTLGNYSKFVRPGYKRVDVTGAVPANVLMTAFTGSDGTVVVVAINKGTADATVPITIAGGTAPAMLTPNVTSAMSNLVAGTAVAVTGGSFMAALPSQSVTTFVGK